MTLPRFLACVSVFATIAFASLTSTLPASAQEDQTLSPKQVEAVRKVMRDYLMEHPEVLQEAIEALREKMRVQAEDDARNNIEAYKADLLNNKDDPVTGNAQGDVTVVEFFDYNCAFCKATYDALMESVKADGKVRVVFKEFPLLSDESALASKLALAARKQNKYDDLHRAYMKYRGKLDEKTVYRLAQEAGVNLDQAKKDMAGPEIDKQIHRNKELARALNIEGTPSFVIGDRIVPQAMDAQTIKQLIEVARKAKPAKQAG